jgi:hypothetical protein
MTAEVTRRTQHEQTEVMGDGMRPLHQMQHAAADYEPGRILAMQRELVAHVAGPQYKPLIDVILDGTSAWLQRLVRVPVPFWVSALVISAAILLTSLLISLVMGEFGSSFRVERVPSEMALVALVFAGMVIIKMEMDEVYAVCGSRIIHHVDSARDLVDLDRWFGWVSKRLGLLLWAAGGGILTGLLAVGYVTGARGEFIGFGPAVLDIVVNVLALIAIYYIACFVNLAHRMGGYRFRMFTLDPHKSEVIYHLSSMFFSYVRSIALFMAAVTLVLGRFGVIDTSVLGVLLVVGWGPIVVAFFLSESTLARIIGNVKWRILEEVQHELEALRSDRAITSNDYLNECDRLLAFHDRIWATPSHALDMTAILSFINTLLLPLVSFALTQLPMFMPWTLP